MMRSVNLAFLLQALIVFVIAVTQAKAGPLSLQRRKNLDVYNPRITEPTETTLWKAGTVEVVSWETSDAPSSISNNGHVVLKPIATGDSRPELQHLAGPFDLRTGQISVTLPEDLVSGQYRIILFGDSGNESDEFHIDGVAPSPDAQQGSEGSEDSDPFGQ